MTLPIFTDGQFLTAAQLTAIEAALTAAQTTADSATLQAAAALAASVPRAGGEMTGPLTLPGDPTLARQAATKQYVDLFLPKTGGTVTGPLIAPISLSTVTAAGGTTLRTSAGRAGDFLSVKDFSAVGDGIHDDTTALRAAFNSGIPVYMVAGSYRTTSPITTGINQIIVGCSVNAYDDPTTIPTSLPVTQIVADNGGGGFAAGSAVLFLGDRATIRDFQITSVAGVDAVSSSGRFVTLERIYTRFGRHGAYLNQVGPRVLFSRFSEASSDGLLSDASCTDGVFVGTFFAGNGGCGMQGLWSVKHSIVGCTAEWNTSHGFAFFNSNSCLMTGCPIDRNSGAGLRIGSSTNMSVTGNSFRRNAIGAGGFLAHVSLASGGLSQLQFTGNHYTTAQANDDLSGGSFPAFIYQLEPSATLSASLFVERTSLGTTGIYADTATATAVRPQQAVSAEGMPGPYANDAAAAGAGVGIGSAYKDTAGIFRARIA